MIEVMKDWQYELEQVKTDSSDEENKELHGPAEDEPTDESQEASSEGSSEAPLSEAKQDRE